MEKLDAQMGLIIRSAWADSTLKTRNSQWSRFIQFCHINSLTPVPAETLTVARFIVNLGLTCVFSTCNNYVSAIVSLQRFFGYDPQLRESFLIQLVLKGLGRNLGKQVNQKIGLTPEQLLDIYKKLDFDNVNVLTKWAAIILAFRSLLRKSNIVPTTYKDQSMVLMRSDVQFTDRGLLLNVRKTKTLQKREYVLQIPVLLWYTRLMRR